MRTLPPSTESGNSPADFAPGRTDASLDAWARLLFIEPSLAELARQASKGGTPDAWLRIIEQLAKFTGPGARRERLRGVRAYQSASDYLRAIFQRAGGVA